jgi:spore germination protein KC
MKKKISKTAGGLSICLVCFLFSGCFNYRDINKLIFATAIILDFDKDTETALAYVEGFRPFRGAAMGSEKGQRLLFKGRGKTLFEALRDINLSATYTINYSQCKAVIFTEKAAAGGIKKFVDFIDRDQEFLVRPYVFVLFSDAEKTLQMNLKEEEYLGLYLFNLIMNVGASSRAVTVTVNEYMSKRLMGSKTKVITGLRIKKEQLEDKVEIDGAAVMVDDKMIEVMRREEGQGYNFLIDEVKTGTLEVSNPDHEGELVTLEILNSDTNTNMKYERGKIKLIKTINVRVALGESQDSLILTEENIEMIKKNAEDNIKKYTKDLFNDYKKMEIDIFEVEEELYRKYPRIKLQNPIKETNLEVNVNVRLEGSSTKGSTL